MNLDCRLILKCDSEHLQALDKKIEILNSEEPNSRYNRSSLLREMIISDKWIIKPFLNQDAYVTAMLIIEISKELSDLNQISRSLNYFKSLEDLDPKSQVALEKDLKTLDHMIRSSLQVYENHAHKS